MNLTGKRALVTGASSGIGRCFAEQLAARGAELVITARRAARLEKIASEISGRHGVRVTPLTLDLAAPGAARELFERTEGARLPIDILINNAGFASYGPFVDTSLEQILGQLHLNILALTELTHRFFQAMQGRHRGHILNVASFAGYMPVPYYAAYAASKAYVLHFTEALAYELRRSKVRVCCLCPGSTATEFWEVAGQKQVPVLIKSAMMTPERTARIGLSALFRKRRNIVAGLISKLVVFLNRFCPRRFSARLAARVVGR